MTGGMNEQNEVNFGLFMGQYNLTFTKVYNCFPKTRLNIYYGKR